MLGNLIKTYLKDNGIKQSFLASELSLKENVLTSMLKGNRKISAEEYIIICKVLNLEMTYFADKISDIKH